MSELYQVLQPNDGDDHGEPTHSEHQYDTDSLLQGDLQDIELLERECQDHEVEKNYQRQSCSRRRVNRAYLKLQQQSNPADGNYCTVLGPLRAIVAT